MRLGTSGSNLTSWTSGIRRMGLSMPGRIAMVESRRSGPFRRAWCLLAVLLVVTPALADADPAGTAGAGSAYLRELLARAGELGLWDRPAWRALGHYRPDAWGSGWHSLVDSPGFFLGGNGKADPADELRATLRAFFEPAGVTTDLPGGQHPQCAYVARYRWLGAQLDFDPARLPGQPCHEFEDWRSTLDATGVSLVFPAAYLNNPASMFGHTLLRLDREGQTEDTRLLSYAVNYGAATDTDNGVLFAVMGLTGGYPGTYSVEPYYELVKRYSDFENRDIWEYRLDFSPAEVDALLAHLWEMRDRYSDYYFFDENCSYQLLFLLDAARPSLALADRFRFHVIPVDSVRAVLSQEGMLRRAVFRPSGETRIREDLARLDPAERTLARRLASGDLPAEEAGDGPIPPAGLARSLELAEAFVTYRLNSGDLDRDIAASRAWSLLKARSHVDVSSGELPVTVPATRPDQGHASARAAAGLGIRDGRAFGMVRLRPAYHDALDPPGGYVPGAGIEFLDTELRVGLADGDVWLERFTGLAIRSMAARNELIRPISWKLDIGVERMRVAGHSGTGALVGSASGGAGLSHGLANDVLLSVMLDAGLSGGEACADTCSFNVGPDLSLWWPVSDRSSFLAEAGYRLRIGESLHDRYRLHVGQSYGLTANLAIRLELGLADDGSGLQPEWLSTLNWYF
ncbi:MAG: DUF4105 domain-containing protein [Geminicoccaceae bacterium]|nr:DUF4105 domain-containing protein [Geminicoccaceae bacterium]